MVSPSQWYAVRAGVWFSAASIQGPWVVAGSIPALIYSIPPSSPLYYVTYVKIYDVTPEYVVVGYTPGYMGAYVAPGGVVVYGTGYAYAPYIGGSVYYPPPLTYGYAANPLWTPWTGWFMGLGVGLAAGYAWEPVVTIIITTVSLRAGVPMVTRDIMVHMAAMHMDTMVGRQPGDLVDMRRRQGMYTITGAQQQQ